MSHYIIWHDNGIRGQTGYSEEETSRTIEQVMADYKAKGCAICRIEIIAEEEAFQ